MLLCKESLLVIINGEADIKTCSVGQTYPREIFLGNTTDVTVDVMTHSETLTLGTIVQRRFVDPGLLTR